MKGCVVFAADKIKREGSMTSSPDGAIVKMAVKAKWIYIEVEYKGMSSLP